jgi:hypothetical protein
MLILQCPHAVLTLPAHCNYCQYMSWGNAGPTRGIFHLHGATDGGTRMLTQQTGDTWPSWHYRNSDRTYCQPTDWPATPGAGCGVHTTRDPWPPAASGCAQSTCTEQPGPVRCCAAAAAHLFQCRWSHHMCSQLSVTLRGPPPTCSNSKQAIVSKGTSTCTDTFKTYLRWVGEAKQR